MIRKLLRRAIDNVLRLETPSRRAPATIPVSQHGIRRTSISAGSRRTCEVLQEAGFKAYQNRQWQEAIREFEALGKYEEDKAARIFIERCRLYQESPPPPDWNGAFVLTKK